MEIYPNIHNIVSENKTGQGITNAYLLTGTTGSVLIDTGWKSDEQSERIISYINKIDCATLKYIIVTHRHPPHWGNSEFVKRHNDATIISTDIEAPYINDYFEIDKKLLKLQIKMVKRINIFLLKKIKRQEL